MVLHYLVAVDGSPQADVAFEVGLNLAKLCKGALTVMAVVEPIHLYPEQFAMNVSHINEVEQRYRQMLSGYGSRAGAEGVRHELLLGTSKAPGELICSVVKSRDVDCVVVGKTGLNSLAKLVLGSTCDYVLKNAGCTVVLARNYLTEEVHVPISYVHKAEEEERARRMKEHEVRVEHDPISKVDEMEEAAREERDPSKPESSLKSLSHIEETKESVIAAEELERSRRIAEENREEQLEKFQSLLNKNLTTMAEEEERRRRIEELKAEQKEDMRQRQESLKSILFEQEEARKYHQDQLCKVLGFVSK